MKKFIGCLEYKIKFKILIKKRCLSLKKVIASHMLHSLFFNCLLNVPHVFSLFCLSKVYYLKSWFLRLDKGSVFNGTGCCEAFNRDLMNDQGQNRMVLPFFNDLI